MRGQISKIGALAADIAVPSLSHAENSPRWPTQVCFLKHKACIIALQMMRDECEVAHISSDRLIGFERGCATSQHREHRSNLLYFIPIPMQATIA